MGTRLCSVCQKPIKHGSFIAFLYVDRAWWNLWRGILTIAHEKCAKRPVT